MKSSSMRLLSAILLIISTSVQIQAPAYKNVKIAKKNSEKQSQEKKSSKSQEDKNTEAAKKIFESYKSAYTSYNFEGYDRHYDKNLRAVITVGGQTKNINGNTWRALSRKTIAQMRSQGIKSQFGEPIFSAKGEYVRVRFQVRTLHEVDIIDWLLKKDGTGQWKIIEERQKATIQR